MDLPCIERGRIGHLLRVEHGLPHIDWWAFEAWRRVEPDVDIRAVAAAWMDEVRDSLSGEYRRWRHVSVEGLAPADGALAQAMAAAADKSVKIVRAALSRALGDVPAPDIGLVVFAGKDEYISFTDYYHPEEGEWATSGGCYLNDGEGCFPLIVTHAGAKWGLEQTIAHEMTHHLLHGRGLPLWVEEGFTQMMEERVTGYTGFKLDREMRDRQFERWEGRLDSFLSGEGFSSGAEDDQELAYHLAEWIARAELSERADAYFRFVRDCRENGAEASALKHLGCGLEKLVARRLGLE